MDYHVFRQRHAGANRILPLHSVVAHQVLGHTCPVLDWIVHVHLLWAFP
jgi:hypothetical protein